MIVDYHVHPDFSPDASGSVADFCRRATESGIDELCFTTHCEVDPIRGDRERVRVAGRLVPADSDWVETYLGEIDRARRSFPNVGVLAGLEIGYDRDSESTVADLVTHREFDFVIGAVHCIDHVAISSRRELDRVRRHLVPRGAEYFAASYFGSVAAAARSGLFDVLAHVDIYRKYIQPLYGDDFAAAVQKPLEDAVRAIARTGVGIEVNTSAFRRGLAEPFPSFRVLAMAHREGTRVFTVGSDAHRPDEVGAGLPEAVGILRRLGVTPARFRRRRLVT